MVLNFLKKKGDAPPDVGQEEAFEAKKEKKKKPFEAIKAKNKVVDEKLKKLKAGSSSVSSQTASPGLVKPGSPVGKPSIRDEKFKLEVDKLNAKVESITELLKGFSERFSNISQQIGEVRAMNLSNEKSISKSTQQSAKAVDIVKEVKPEELRVDFQRSDMRVNTLAEKIEATKQFAETVMDEIKDLRRKSSAFIGTDSILKLNEEVKEDLIELQKMGARVRVNADKSEQIFIELKKGLAETQKFNEMFNNLDKSYSSLQKEVEKLRVDYSNIVKQNEFGNFKKTTDAKFLAFDNSLSNVEDMKKESERLAGIVETILAIVKKNEEDLENLAVTVGEDRIKKVSDYDEKFSQILNVVEEITGEISDIKKKMGMKVSSKFFEDGGALVNKIRKDKEKKSLVSSNKRTALEPASEPSGPLSGPRDLIKRASDNLKNIKKKVKGIKGESDKIKKHVDKKVGKSSEVDLPVQEEEEPIKDSVGEESLDSEKKKVMNLDKKFEEQKYSKIEELFNKLKGIGKDLKGEMGVKDAGEIKKEKVVEKTEIPFVERKIKKKKIDNIKKDSKMKESGLKERGVLTDLSINKVKERKMPEKKAKSEKEIIKKKIIKPEKKPVKKKVDKRLKALEKARKVRARNLERKKKVYEQRIRNLKKARAARKKSGKRKG